ncbi:T9SS type A sorting domain-containing protein [Portibacter lacus]|nr:T9SS type A sorting domain-containing protein [Portibacter lacus]
MKLTLFTILILSSFSLNAQCPVIQFQDLRGVIGFPQFDNTSQCGDADTLSLLVFTDSPGEILGFNLKLDLVDGLNYAGISETYYGGNTTISYGGGSPTCPEFSLGGVTDPDDVFIASIGLVPDCNLDLNDLYYVGVEYEYTFMDTSGNIIECEGTFQIEQELNSALKRPELNMNTVSPVTRNITSLGQPYCQTMVVSQDGLQASLNEMTFEVTNFPTIDPNVSIVSISANAIDLPFTANSDSSVIAVVDGSYFIGNTSPNPTDDKFNTGEKITFSVCYQSDLCPEQSIFNPVYEASYGCGGDVCNSTSQVGTVRVQPTGAADPIASASFTGPLQICGNAGTITLSVTNPGDPGLENTYTDLSVGYETCERTNLGIGEVRIGATVLSDSDYSWIGDDLKINFDSLAEIPGSGLTDADGDGYFDDLEGGATVNLEIDMIITCGINEVDATSLECPTINCPFATFFVEAKANCGNTFSRFPSVEPFNLNYGPTGVLNDNEVNIGTTANPIQGYDFGQHGTPSNNSTPLPPATIDYVFCYDFGSENIDPCPTGADYSLKLTFSGTPRIVQDYEVVPGSMAYSVDNGADISIPDGNATFMTPDPATPGIRMLTIDGGAVNNTVCYKMQLQLDTAYCSPRQFVAVSQQVVEYCSDCDCEIVKACKNTQFVSDPQYFDCVCLVGHEIEVTRKNLGFTDHTMTTRVDRQVLLDNCPADLTNFGPGDTMAVAVKYDIKDLDAITNMNMWLFSARVESTSGLLNTAELPLTPDRRAGGIVKWEVIKAGQSPVEFSFGDFASCDSRTGNTYSTNDERDGNEIEYGFAALSDRGVQDLTTDYDVNTIYPGNSSLDGYDNTINAYLYVRNAQQSNECGTTTNSSGGNCLQEFFDSFNFAVGDTIKVYHEYPMKRNPYRAAAIAAGENPGINNSMRLRFNMTMYNYDEFGNANYCYTTLASSCNSYPIVNVAEYGGVTAITELDLDNCGGSAKHTFSIANPAPTGWYQCEFRPIANIDDVDAPMFGPFAYCSNAMVEDYDGNIIPLEVDSTINAYCTTVASVTGQICATEDAGIGDGKVIFDLSSQGVRPLGVGLMNDDSLVMSYDLCALCPNPFEIDYELIYDWSDICDAPRDPAGYRCNTGGVNGVYSYCDQLGISGNYYSALNLDTLQYHLDESSVDFIVNDNRVDDAGMSSANQGPELIASGGPGTAVEYQEILLCNADAALTQSSVSGSVTVPNSVKFVGAYRDASNASPLPTTLVADDGTYKTYSIATDATSLAPGECETVFIGTTLLFCPELPAPPPQICVSAVSGCADPDVTTALAGSGTCGSAEDCYAYIAGEADLQTEWYNTPENTDLCQTDTFYIRVKNTKQLALLNLETVVNIPPGITIVPGSWEAAYPGGSVGLMGTFGTWNPITPQPNASGTAYTFVDDDYSADIVNTGLPGVFAQLDSNNVSFRFVAVTECDEFISGSKFTTETTASDPCGPNRLESGVVDSPPMIISGADPRQSAQILTTAQPKNSYCIDGPSTFGLTALNIGENPTASEVQTCITIPMSSLTYEANSISFTNPSYTPTTITEEVSGNDVIVCFDSPPLNPGQKFSVQFMATQPQTAECGVILLGMDVKSFQPAVQCESIPEMSCGVYIQNSINPSLVLEMGPPLQTVDVRLNRQCNAGTDPENMCYEIDLVNPGEMNYTGDITIGIHDDVLADGVYDNIVDEELASFVHSNVSVDAGAMTTITMCLDVPAAQACPILLRQTFATACACDEAITPFNNIPPAFLDTIENVVLCAGDPFTTEICGDYTFTLEPAEGGVITENGSTLSVTLNSGFGIDEAVVLIATENIGDCKSEASVDLFSTGDYMPADLAFQVCEGECIDPDLMIPDNIAEGSTITITQAGTATMGADLNMSNPEICGLVPNMTDTYTVTITSSPTCSYEFDFTVEVLPILALNITEEEVCNHPLFGGTIEAETGFDNYQFFFVLPNGTEVLKSAGSSNTYNTDVEGDYVIKATSAANLCPAVGYASISSDFCVDLALKKEVVSISPGPTPTTGGTVQYRIRVYNQGGVDMMDVDITDYVPVGLTNNDGNWNPGGLSNGPVTYNAPIAVAAGDSADVFITLTVNEGANFENTINIAEISGMTNTSGEDVSLDDIDSTPDGDPLNDAGGNPNSGSDNVVGGDGTNGGGSLGDSDPLTDEDDHDPATLDVFDLALTKTVDPASVPPSGMFTLGDTINFFVTVINQGSIDATDVVITDLIPCGMEFFDENLSTNVGAGWGTATLNLDASSGYQTQTTIASIPAGTSVQVPIKMVLALPTGGLGHTLCGVGMDSYLNYSYIESALDGDGMPVSDIDSDPGSFTPEEEATTPNESGDNDITSTGNGQPGSQDDSDPANIEIFDLALSKILNPDNGPYQYNDVATFEICVTNQGNVPSDDLQIVDYIPSGYAFAPSNDPKWTDNGDGTATYDADPSDFAGNTTPGQIGFLEQVCVNIELIVQPSSGDPLAYVNTAEIAGANTVIDPDGPLFPGPPVSTPVTADNDGAFDTDMTNDAGGALGTGSDAMTSDTDDPAIQGDGTGAPGDTDPATDSDDADIAAIDIVDFALKKTIASPEAPYAYGDTITFEITVYNQGTVTGENIEITDYSPIGLEYIANPLVNPNWSGSDASHMTVIDGPLVSGDSTSVFVKMIVNNLGNSQIEYTNVAEISDVDDTDGNSIRLDDVDSTPNTDPFDDAGGAVNTDSDNAIDGNGTGANGDTDPLTDEDDNDPAFVQIFDLALTKEIVGGPYSIGDLVEYQVTTINQGNTPVANVVLSDYVPSGLAFTAGENMGWAFVGTNPTGITINTTITDTIYPGDEYETSLFLRVQVGDGSVEAYTNVAEITSFEDINGNSSTDDPTIVDSDSTPDDDPTNDAGGNPDSDSDDSVNGDGTGMPGDDVAGTDEDDADPAKLSIADLALIKTTAETGPFSYGDTITFDISVVNQGNVVASNVEVTDYIPSGFEYALSNNPTWSYDGTNATTIITGPVITGDSIVVSIDLVIVPSATPADAYTNEAEISEAFEEDGLTPFDDVDSEADNDNTNDAGGSPMTDSDNALDGTGTNGMGVPDDADGATDEDDADPEMIEIVDVAQTKMIASAGPFMYGDSIEFTITTYNQGNVPLTNIVISDYIPDGFTLSGTSEGAGWAVSANGAEFIITDILLPGEEIETPILLILGMTTGSNNAYTNVSEVSMMTDTLGMDVSGDDVDSDINNDPTDNGGGEPNTDSDDAIDGDGTGMPGDTTALTDEDNSDPAFVEILDLAVIMENSDDVISMYGDSITFPITLTNQGNVASDSPEVTVMVPDGFAFDGMANPDWIDNGDGTVTYAYPDTLAPGDLEMFDLVLIAQPATGDGAWTPVVAITADNPISETPGLTDIDSDIDGDPSNDAGGNPTPDTGDGPIVGSDDSLTGDGSGNPDDTDPATDSDASDPEFVRIMDVAQTKMVIGAGPYVYGDTIPFLITTYNQGNIALVNTEISDYVPLGFTYAGDINTGWTGVDGPGDQTITYTIPDTIIGGTSVEDTVMLILTMTTGGLDNYTNTSEVSFAQDTLGNDTDGNGPNGGLDDVDSDINNDPTDNGGGEPNTGSDDAIDGDGTGMPGDTTALTDEDNSDPAFVEILDLAVIMENSDDVISMYGDSITFPITLTNQGNVASDSPEVTVMVPDGFVFYSGGNPDWIDNGDGTVTYAYPDTLAPGDLEMFDLILFAQPATGDGAWTPVVAITADNPISETPGLTDIDSDIDGDPSNDAGGNPTPDTGDGPIVGSDDSLTGDGSGNPDDTDPATDSDASDPEFVRIMDVAQTKMVIGAGPYVYGDTIPFLITTYNQGNIALVNTEISDYVPLGFTYAGDINTGWTGVDGPGDQTITYTIPDTIIGGTSVEDTVMLILTMTTGGLDNYTNTSEVSFAQDTLGNDTDGNGPNGGLDDVDSDINNDPTDNGGGEPNTDSDDAIDGDGTGMPGDTTALTDEDNSDPAFIEVFDLALILGASEDTLTMYNQTVTFPVTIANQGNVASESPEITVMVPDGFAFDGMTNPDWEDNGDGTVTYVYPDTLAPGDSEMFDLILTSQPASGPDAWTPIGEITSDNPISDTPDITDIDSTPDDTFDNDAGGAADPDSEDGNFPGSDDILDGDGTGMIGDTDAAGDEDDNDPELVNIFDLALTKKTMMTTGNSFGDTIQFMIKVYNQGNIPATNVEITDFMPDGFDYVTSNDTTGWSFDPGLMTATIQLANDTIQPGDSLTVNYYVTIMMSNMGDAFQNQAEISAAEDDNGNSTDDGSLVDADSTPDDDNTNDPGGNPGTDSDDSIDGDGTNGGGSPGDTNADTDEDDSDPALIQVIDVAIQKTIVDGQAPYSYGTPVNFLVKVINQGNEPLHNVEVTDYIPVGYTYDVASDAAGWAYDSISSVATTVIPGPMNQWDSTEIIITLIPERMIPSNDPEAWTNVAEVSEMFDGEGMDISGDDIDSNADDDPDNDPGGAAGTDSDDSLSGDGNNGGGAPGDTDANSDEDDSDPALLPIFDLALTKQLVYPDSIYAFGDEMEFFITLDNQGNIPATNILVTEYVPGALTEVGATNDPTWMFGGATATYLYEDTLQAGSSDTIYLNMVFQIGSSIEDYVNYAEISEAADTMGNNTTDNPDVLYDIDSTPDDIADNDAGGNPDTDSDDAVDGDGSGMFGDELAETDEDDHDPVQLGYVDMALVKTLVTTGPVQVGQDVTFNIEVINQGTFPMVAVEVVDYIPAGFELSAANGGAWTEDVDGNARMTLAGPIGFEESDTVQIILTVLPNANADNMVNVGELSEFFFEFGDEATDHDIDSQADTIPDNDAGGMVYTDSDDAVDGDGTGIPGDDVAATDEDDADPAVPEVLDLSLVKTVAEGTAPVRPGDLVTFNIEVCNQGNVPVEGVTIYDTIPSGLAKDPSVMDGWTLVSENTYAYVITERLLRDSCITIQIELEVQPESVVADMINVAEIAQVLDTLGNDVSDQDIDSTPNDDNGEAEDTYGTDDDDATDGSVHNGEDSDDADPAAPPVFDLAIRKINTVAGSSNIGDIVPFNITVFNQGNVPATQIVVTDYVPDGLGLASVPENADWALVGGQYEYLITDTIYGGQDTTIQIFLEVLPNAVPMNVVNMTEISSALDTSGVDVSLNDYDSNGDSDNGNDVGNELYDFDNDNVTDEFGIDQNGATGMDEDDHDQAWVLICDAILCTGDINISLDEMCMAELTPSMLLNGPVFPDHVYDIEIVGPNGVVKEGNIFGSEDVGKMFEVSIINPLCGENSCWGKVLVENKFPPVIECKSDTISCGELLVLDPPTVINNCGEVTLKLIDRTTVDVACEDPNLQLIITETWVASDPSGVRTDTCTQTLSVEKFDITEVVGPSVTDTLLSCSVGTMPSPETIGVPTLNGIALYPDNFAECGIFVDFEDEFFSFGNDCSSGVQRTWTVNNWICGTDNSVTFTQLITFIDTTGPVLSNVPSDITVSTSGFTCEAQVAIPAITTVDECNPEGIRVDIQYEGGFVQDQNGVTVGLSAGTSTVTYVVYDVCGNTSTASYNVTVQDLEQPVTICDAFTTVSLNSEGKASLSATKLDNGSMDECGPVTLEISRMDDELGFLEAVDFSCADIGTENIMVALRVTDVSGNSNTCMAQVEIQDKVPPVLISGLPDITISCTFPFSEDNLSVFGTIVNDADSINAIVIDDPAVQFSGPAQDGLILDNCSTAAMSEVMSGDLNSCGSGTMIRTITATSPNGETTSLTQRITLVNPTPFVESDITWPIDITVNQCNGDGLDPLNLPEGQGYPIYAEDNCDMVSSTYEDRVLSNTPNGGGCLVIERTWYVSDWCQKVNNQYVIFEDVQLITINNNVAPVITSTCEDIRVESLDGACGGAQVSLTASATDDCVTAENLIWTWTVDLDSDGTIDSTGTGNDASAVYPVGTHKVNFIVGDGCGNLAGCSYTFEVDNVKAPSPKCFQGLSASLTPMDTTGDNIADTEMLMLTPDYIDAGSDHPCGYDLQLSFSADVNDTLRIFGCDDLGQQGIQLWVTDQNGNQDFCATFIIVEDNNDVDLCPSVSELVDITGALFTEEDVEISEVEVYLDGSDLMNVSDETGNYNFSDMPKGGSYEVMPEKNTDHSNGVTTLDLIMIQKHILGITEIESPYKLLAADINNNGKITGSDLLELRKLILGIYDEFPNNTSWRFVDGEHSFIDSSDPWAQAIPETTTIDVLNKDTKVDFYGLKVGDINGSVEMSGLPLHAEVRSTEAPFVLSYEDRMLKAGELVNVPVYADSIHNIIGYQFTLNVDARLATIGEVTGIGTNVSGLNFGQRYADKGILTSSWDNSAGQDVDGTSPIFMVSVIAHEPVRLSEILSLSSDVTKAEAYSSKGELMDVELELRGDAAIVGLPELFQNQPNPWAKSTIISFSLPEAARASIRIYDVAGKLVKEHTADYKAGLHKYEVIEEEFSSRGVYYYELLTNDYKLSKKMVLIK